MFKNKLVGKRQLQRRIKLQTDHFKNVILSSSVNNLNFNNKLELPKETCSSDTIHSTITSSSSMPVGNHIQEISNNQNQGTSNNHINYTEKYPILDYQCELHGQFSPNKEFDLSDESEDDMNSEMKSKLQKWVNSYNITQNATTALLKILRPRLTSLPKDSRSLMKTPRTTKLIPLKNGSLHYFGLEETLLTKLKYGISENVEKILIQINIDGLPLFKSTSTELYPILARCIALKDNSPFTVALFCGTGKPDPIEIFLQDFITEVNDLKTRKIMYQNKLYDFDIHFFICDAPARAYLRQTVGHNAKHGCEKCRIVGSYSNHRINYAQERFVAFNKKLDSDFTQNHLIHDYIKGKSPLLNMNINLVTQFPLDPMHLLFLGVIKRILLNYYFNSSSHVKLSQKIKNEIEANICEIQGFITSDFPRKSRTFKELHRWKATEFKLFIKYTFPVILYNALNTTHYNLILLLHCAIFILSNDDLINKYLDVADQCLKDFVIKSATIFGNDFVVFNVHNLIHLVDDVRLYGTINDFSCFPFENHMSYLKRKLHSSNKPLQQLHRRIQECDNSTSNNIQNDRELIDSTSKCEPKNINNKFYDAEKKIIIF